MADGRTGKGYPKAQHSNSFPLNNTAGHQHGRGTGAGTRNWHGCGLPTRVVGVSARCPHRRALLTPARVISPSRYQQPPRDVNDPLAVPTTRVHAGNPLTMPTTRAGSLGERLRVAPAFEAAFEAPPPGPHSQRPGNAHKDPDLRNTRRTQGLDPALVCGAVFPNSLPCVRHREGARGAERAGHGHPLETLGGPLGTPSGPQRTHGKGAEVDVLRKKHWAARWERRAVRSGPG